MSGGSTKAVGDRSLAAGGSIMAATTGDYSPLTVVHHHLPAPAPTALAALPPAPDVFTGREVDLNRLLDALRPHAAETSAASGGTSTGAEGNGPPSAVVSVAGLAGVGKSALVFTAGQAACDRDWFTGTVFLNLRGYDEAPVRRGQALEAFLRALGIPSERIPRSDDEKEGLYRSRLHDLDAQGHRLLIVADNANSPAHVRPLIPVGRSHRLLVTSRHTLSTLGARLVNLAPLANASAVTLLDQALQAADPSDRRVRTAGVHAEKLARLCDALPLALHIMAALLISDPELTVEELTAELTQSRSRLQYFCNEEVSVRASLDLSYRRLPAEQQDLFRLLALNPGPHISLQAAAILAGQPTTAVRGLMRQLLQAHLVTSSAGRWSMHDLVRLYASDHVTSVTDAVLTPDTQAGQHPAAPSAAAQSLLRAQARLLQHYAETTIAANTHLAPTPPRQGPSSTFASRDEALAWLDAERENLTAAVAAAATARLWRIATQLPLALYDYLDQRRYFDDLVAINTIARDTAALNNDTATEAKATNNLAIAYAEQERYDEALASYTHAAALFAAVDDQLELGRVLNGHGSALYDLDRPAEALAKHTEALTIQRATGDVREQAAVLNNLSRDYRELEDHPAALATAEEAASLFHQLEDAVNEATVLANIALTHQAQGRAREARTSIQQALTIVRCVDAPYTGTLILLTAGQFAEARDLDEAISYYRQATIACEGANAPELLTLAREYLNNALHVRE
ncbi:tetratricopeptide repeat protein [Streptomyces sp. NPDC006706]|uniref:tetratricopeptide repeat protein n=1 Tax=Streptomyces sp. NPDC006706 TaxID=3364761 RepID=UPI0036B22444